MLKVRVSGPTYELKDYLEHMEKDKDGCKHINLAANVYGYTPVSLGRLIKDGVLADIESIHRMTIDRATEKKTIKIAGKIMEENREAYEMLADTEKND